MFSIAESYHRRTGRRCDIITIGPLSNLALAVRLQPRLTALVGTVFIMGGAERGHGNVAFPSLCAEYNMYADPEGAAVVFSTFPSTVMCSWELTLKYGLHGEFLKSYLTRNTEVGRFLSDVTQHLLAVSGDEIITKRGLMIPDPLAMCVALRPHIILTSAKHAVFVELRGVYTRGATVVDWRDKSGHAKTCEVVDTVDFEEVKAMLLDSVR